MKRVNFYNKFSYTFWMLSIFISIFSCNKIDIAPVSSLTNANFFKNANDINLAVLGVYNRYQSKHPRDWIVFEMSTDNLYRSEYITVGGLEEMDLANYQSSNAIFRDFWRANYNGIFRANTVLDFLDIPQDYSGSMKNQFEGEAKFMRALFYFDLVRAFGGIPKITKMESISEASKIPRASEDEIYSLIIEDLLAAINLLPTYNNADKGRASKEAATALLGKVYVYNKDWANADKTLDMVIGEQFDLLENFGDLWKEEYEDNKEVIFAIKYLTNQNGQRLSLDFLPYQGVDGFVGSGGGELALPSWSAMKIFSDGDTRKDATFTFYWKEPNTDKQPVWRPFISKFLTQVAQSSGLDLPIIRYADVLLLKSEVCFMLDQPDCALQYLNMVRSRGFQSNNFNYSRSDIQSMDDFIDKLLLERNLEFAYESERRPDLIRTGRYTAVMKDLEWYYNPEINKAQEVSVNIQPYQLLYPIPQAEIDIVGKDILLQNPGY